MLYATDPLMPIYRICDGLDGDRCRCLCVDESEKLVIVDMPFANIHTDDPAELAKAILHADHYRPPLVDLFNWMNKRRRPRLR